MRQASRATYRKDHPLSAGKLVNGLRTPGTSREVFAEGMDHPVTAMCYSLPEAAEALGRTVITFKRWIVDGIIPPPLLAETTHNYRQYSQGELRVIADAIARHEREFSYIHRTYHTVTINDIWQRIQGYRASHI